MIRCQECNERATRHVTEIVRGKAVGSHVCEKHVADLKNLKSIDATRKPDFDAAEVVDEAIKGAINICWMFLPNEQKHVEAIEAEFRRRVESVIEELRADPTSLPFYSR